MTAVENSDTEEETLGALKGDSGMSSPVIAVLQDFLNEDSAECQQKIVPKTAKKSDKVSDFFELLTTQKLINQCIVSLHPRRTLSHQCLNLCQHQRCTAQASRLPPQ